MTPERQALENLLKTAPYMEWEKTHPTDAFKIRREMAGDRRPRPGNAFAANLVTLIRAHPGVVTDPLPTEFDPFDFWRSVGFFQSWGLGIGSNWADNPQGMAEFALSKRAEWVAIEDTATNRAKRDRIKAALAARGIKMAVWGWVGGTQDAVASISFWRPDAWIANVEHYDWEQSLPATIAGLFPSLPRAVISNFTGTGATQAGLYDRNDAAKWINTGFAYIPECYMVNEQGAQPTLSPQNQEWTAMTHLGWPKERIFPCFGLYRTQAGNFDAWRNIWPLRKPGLDFYKSEVAQYPYHSFYLLENIAP